MFHFCACFVRDERLEGVFAYPHPKSSQTFIFGIRSPQGSLNSLCVLAPKTEISWHPEGGASWASWASVRETHVEGEVGEAGAENREASGWAQGRKNRLPSGSESTWPWWVGGWGSKMMEACALLPYSLLRQVWDS